MVIIVDITQVVHKGTNYLNKTISVCQYNLVYTGNVWLIVGNYAREPLRSKGENNITLVPLVLKPGQRCVIIVTDVS